MARQKPVEMKVDRKQARAFFHSKSMREVMEDRTERVAEAAKALAPVRTGAYRDGITPVVDKGRNGWEGRVEGRDRKSAWIEFGTLRRPGLAPLRKATEQVFGKIDATDKENRRG